MSELALHAALTAYEADLSSPKLNRGTCIEIRASARQAATEAFCEAAPKDSRVEGLLAAATHHDELASGWHETARYYESRPDGVHWELSIEWATRADARAVIHREMAQDFKSMAAGASVLRKPPFKFS